MSNSQSAMEAVLSAYGSDDDMADFASTVPPIHSTAPVVTSSTSRHASSEQEGSGLDPSSRVVYHNPRASRLFSAVHGAAAPRADGEGFLDRRRNHRSGHVEVDYTSTAAFETQYESFMSKGYGRERAIHASIGVASLRLCMRCEDEHVRTQRERQREKQRHDDEKNGREEYTQTHIHTYVCVYPAFALFISLSRAWLAQQESHL